MTTRKCAVKEGIGKWGENREKPMEPLLPIIDPHHHLWPRREEHIGKEGEGKELAAVMADLFGERSGFDTYLYKDLAKDMRDNNVVATQFLQCGAFHEEHAEDPLEAVKETTHVQGIGDSDATLPMTIIGHANLMLGPDAIRPVVEAHARCRSFRGIRDSIIGDQEKDKAKPKDPKFQASVRMLGEMGLTYESWLVHSNLADFEALAKACPGTTLICDHIGQPVGVGEAKRPECGEEPGGEGGPRDEVIEEWRAAVTSLAKSCPNVVMKVGGMTMPICGWGFEKRDAAPGSEELAARLAPFYHHCIREFGPSRCMFESNFPVDKASCSYTALWNALKRIAGSYEPKLSDDDMTALFSGTARRVYRIPERIRVWPGKPMTHWIERVESAGPGGAELVGSGDATAAAVKVAKEVEAAGKGHIVSIRTKMPRGKAEVMIAMNAAK